MYMYVYMYIYIYLIINRYVHKNKFLQIYYICVLKPEEHKRSRRNLQIYTHVCAKPASCFSVHHFFGFSKLTARHLEMGFLREFKQTCDSFSARFKGGTKQ